MTEPAPDLRMAAEIPDPGDRPLGFELQQGVIAAVLGLVAVAIGLWFQRGVETANRISVTLYIVGAAGLADGLAVLGLRYSKRYRLRTEVAVNDRGIFGTDRLRRFEGTWRDYTRCQRLRDGRLEVWFGDRSVILVGGERSLRVERYAHSLEHQRALARHQHPEVPDGALSRLAGNVAGVTEASLSHIDSSSPRSDP